MYYLINAKKGGPDDEPYFCIHIAKKEQKIWAAGCSFLKFINDTEQLFTLYVFILWCVFSSLKEPDSCATCPQEKPFNLTTYCKNY